VSEHKHILCSGEVSTINGRTGPLGGCVRCQNTNTFCVQGPETFCSMHSSAPVQECGQVDFSAGPECCSEMAECFTVCCSGASKGVRGTSLCIATGLMAHPHGLLQSHTGFSCSISAD